MSSRFDDVRALIADTFQIPLEAVSADTRAEEVSAWDSIGHVNLMMALEQTFDLELDVEAFPTLDSVAAILAYLAQEGLD